MPSLLYDTQQSSVRLETMTWLHSFAVLLIVVQYNIISALFLN